MKNSDDPQDATRLENLIELVSVAQEFVVRPEVELMVTASEIPDHITVDLTGREIGDSIHINDITLPAGVKPTIDRNFVIANIAAPSGLRSADNEEAAAEATAE